jgi:hypothetical protein
MDNPKKLATQIFLFFFIFKHIFIDELHITFFFTIQYNIGFRNKRNAYINPFPKFFFLKLSDMLTLDEIF